MHSIAFGISSVSITDGLMWWYFFVLPLMYFVPFAMLVFAFAAFAYYKGDQRHKDTVRKRLWVPITLAAVAIVLHVVMRLLYPHVGIFSYSSLASELSLLTSLYLYEKHSWALMVPLGLLAALGLSLYFTRQKQRSKAMWIPLSLCVTIAVVYWCLRSAYVTTVI